MSRLEIPVRGRTLWATGDVLLLAEVDLRLKDAHGNYHDETFRIDSATDITTFPAHLAKQLGLPLPQAASPGVTHVQTGLEIRAGLLRFRVSGMDPTEYVVPAFFLGDPDAPPDPNQPARLPRNLLQPLQLIDRLRFTLDKDPSGPLHGTVLIEKK